MAQATKGSVAQPPSALATMIGSTIAGMIARIPCHPIDTVKARVQIATGARRGILATAADILRTDGVRGFYRGIGITFVGSGPGTMLYFTGYELCKRRLTEQLPWLSGGAVAFCAGMFAEALSCILFVPIDVIKERMQVQSRAAVVAAPSGEQWYYRDSLDAVRSIMRGEGIAGVYRGYGATLASFGPFSALYFLMYEQFKSHAAATLAVDVANLPCTAHMLCASSAGAAASALTCPLDLVKLRMQVQRSRAAANVAEATAAPNAAAYRNLLAGLQHVLATEGAPALFRGVTARILFHTPTTAITMTLFERCARLAADVVDRPATTSLR